MMKYINRKITCLFIIALFLFIGRGAAYANVQTPWVDQENGLLEKYQSSYNYTTGYRFSPNKNGKIVRLGGFFGGDKVVKVWDTVTGQVVASATVSGEYGKWKFVDIDPVSISSSRIYIVAAYMGDGAVKRYAIDDFCQGCGDVEIYSSMRAYGNSMPNIYFTGTMIGLVDIGFIPDDELNAIKPVSRQIETIGTNEKRITINLDLSGGPYAAYGIREFFPQGSEVTAVSHDGVVLDDRIEWIASEFTNLSVNETQVWYEIRNEGPNMLYLGSWVSVGPDAHDYIGGEFWDE